MKSLIKRLITWSRDQQAAETARIAETVAFHRPPPPSPPQEISCFVKGLIHSMKTEPEKWTEARGDIYVHNYEHSESGVVLRHSNTCGPITSVRVSGAGTTNEEEAELARALVDYVIEPPRIKFRKERDAKNSAIRAHFEKLGCPDKTP